MDLKFKFLRHANLFPRQTIVSSGMHISTACLLLYKSKTKYGKINMPNLSQKCQSRFLCLKLPKSHNAMGIHHNNSNFMSKPGHLN